MNRVRTGELPWTKLDALHRTILDRILGDFGISGLTESEADDLNRAWHRLKPWPDTVAGLTRLKKRFTIAPLSNGNIALMTDLAKHSGLPWDCILGAELVRHYKPDREVYESAAGFLNLEKSDVMMVAAHLGDLRAAKGVGLRTAFVTRESSVRTLQRRVSTNFSPAGVSHSACPPRGSTPAWPSKPVTASSPWPSQSACRVGP